MNQALEPSEPQSERQTETRESPTTNKGGRPTRSTPEPAKWTIRGIEPETRRVIEKAADRSGKTLGQFFNDEVREAATNVLKKGDQPPARQEDLRTEIDDLKTFVARLASLSELDRQRDESLRVIQETLANRPASLREWLFGKK
jgi:uncharacterized protein (DUF1778 family)